MKTLKESILSDVEDTLRIGDDFDKMIRDIEKSAEKDWKKFLNTKRSTESGDYRQIRINCRSLAKFLALEPNLNTLIRNKCNHFNKDYEVMFDNLDTIWCKMRTDDCITGPYKRAVLIELQCESFSLGSFILQYCDENDDIINGMPNDINSRLLVKRNSNAQREGVDIILSNIKAKFPTAKALRDALHELNVKKSYNAFDLYNFYN